MIFLKTTLEFKKNNFRIISTCNFMERGKIAINITIYKA